MKQTEEINKTQVPSGRPPLFDVEINFEALLLPVSLQVKSEKVDLLQP